MRASSSDIELLVCVKCRGSNGAASGEDGETRPGALLFDQLRATAAEDDVQVTAVECLSNCSQGCSVALRGGAHRWSYVYGNLDEGEHVDVIREGTRLYKNTSDGLVPWRERPEHFRKNCIARIPPMEV